MTPCVIHHISTTLCGCAVPERKPERPDTSRDFTELSIGTRVRFANAMREIVTCPTCGLRAVPVADLHRRRWPFRENGEAVEKKALRIVYVHDATIGGAGYVLGGSCTVYELPTKKKRKK